MDVYSHIFDKISRNFIKSKPPKDCDFEPNSKLMIILIQLYIGSFYKIHNHTKFGYFKIVYNNEYINKSTKDFFIELFCKAQRHYYCLHKFLHNYVVRKAPIQITHDLIMNPIDKTQQNVISIYQNGQNYLFTVSDLKNIIENALSNSPFFFSEPLPIKNPYNNLEFNKSSLYQIYFFMKMKMFVMPTIFHEYFMCNFHLTRFYNENAVLIRKIYIEKTLRNDSSKQKERTIKYMLSNNKMTAKWRIHSKFPQDKLCQIMEPYLKLYYSSVYSLDLDKRTRSQEELRYSLYEFYRFNRKFGMKLYEKEGNKTKLSYFDSCPVFKKHNYSKDYHESHLDIFDDLAVLANVNSYEEEDNPEVVLNDFFTQMQNDDDDDDEGDEYDSES